jgi:MoxR-like ATPase
MGAWAHGSFDNDDALDLVDDFKAAKTWYPAFEVITSVIEAEDGYLEAPIASKALAAAEVIAAALGRPAIKVPEELASWVASSKAPNRELVEKARRAVERVLRDSELKELWDESSDSALWHQEVEGLLLRLSRVDT